MQKEVGTDFLLLVEQSLLNRFQLLLQGLLRFALGEAMASLVQLRLQSRDLQPVGVLLLLEGFFVLWEEKSFTLK